MNGEMHATFLKEIKIEKSTVKIYFVDPPINHIRDLHSPKEEQSFLIGFQYTPAPYNTDVILQVLVLDEMLRLINFLSLEKIHQQLDNVKYDPTTYDPEPVLNALGYTL